MNPLLPLAIIAGTFLSPLHLGSAFAQQGPGYGQTPGPGQTFGQAGNYVNLGVLTVATLPQCNANTLGMRAFVSDATAPAFNTVLAGSGAVFVEAHCTLATANTYRWVGY